MKKEAPPSRIPKKIQSYLSFIEKQPKGTVYKSASSRENNTPPKNTQAHLDELKARYASCKLCPLATQGRTNIVFGQGNPQAALMFIGEGPGRDEDLKAIPFIGRAGQLLTKIIEAMGLTRKDVYISNVVKCRPPNNRAPLPEESHICKTHILFQEIEIIKPKIICTLGAVATQELLGEPVSITRIRGIFFEFNTIPLIPTFHPAYLLRNPTKKQDVWDDMKKIMAKLQKK